MFPILALDVARRLFVFGCLLPTLCIASWAIRQSWPGAHARAARQLSQTLRLDARFTSVARPRPGQRAFTHLTLHDPITSDLAAQFQGTLLVSQRGDERTFLADHLRLELMALPRWLPWFQNHVYDNLTRQPGHYQLHVEHLELTHRDDVWPIGKLQVDVAISAAQSHLKMTIVQQGRMPVHLAADFAHTAEKQHSTLTATLDQVPLLWLTPFYPASQTLGPNAHCQNVNLRWEEPWQQPWQASLRGRLGGIDLAQATSTWHSPSSPWQGLPICEGQASLMVLEGELRPREACWGIAEVSAPDGAILRDWLEFLRSGHRTAHPSRDMLQFSQLEAQIRATPQGWFVGPVEKLGTIKPLLRDARQEVLLQLTEERRLPR